MDLSHPESRIEKFLAKLLKLSPDPYPCGVRSRIEAYLRYMIENGVPATKTGYYYNGEFYNDAEHTDKISPVENMLYNDKLTHKLYLWDSSTKSYVVVSGGGGGGSTAEDISYDGTLSYSNGTVGKALNSLGSNKIDKPDEEIPEGYVYKSDGEGSGSWQEESGGVPYQESDDPPEDTDIFWIDPNDHSVPEGTSSEYITYSEGATYSSGTVGKELQDLNSKKISQPDSTVPEGYIYKSDGSGSGSWQEESSGGNSIFVAIYNETSFNDIDEAIYNNTPVVLVHPDYGMTLVCIGDNISPNVLNTPRLMAAIPMHRFEGIIEDGELHKIAYATVTSEDSWNFEIFCLDSEFINYDEESEYSDGSIGKELKTQSNDITNIKNIIPEDATSENQLADKEWVESIIEEKIMRKR